jgi:hypothetical protein
MCFRPEDEYDEAPVNFDSTPRNLSKPVVLIDGCHGRGGGIRPPESPSEASDIIDNDDDLRIFPMAVEG